MKREEKNALARQRILDAAVGEFSRKGYDGASLTAFCTEHGISKGIVYHHFRDKNELYLLCVRRCFTDLTAYLTEAMADAQGTAEERMQVFFQYWLRFFAEHPQQMGIFSNAVFRTPPALAIEIDECRRGYDELYTDTMMAMLAGRQLRENLPPEELVKECSIYMDFYNTRFMLNRPADEQENMEQQEKRCRQQINVLFYGILR